MTGDDDAHYDHDHKNHSCTAAGAARGACAASLLLPGLFLRFPLLLPVLLLCLPLLLRVLLLSPPMLLRVLLLCLSLLLRVLLPSYPLPNDLFMIPFY